MRADTLHRLLERLKDKLPAWMRPREAGAGVGSPPVAEAATVAGVAPPVASPPQLAGASSGRTASGSLATSDRYDPHARHTSLWDLLVTSAHLARRVVWLLLSYVRVSLVFVWYCLMVIAWEQYCWSESCVACPASRESLCTDYRTNCHVDPLTVAKGYPVWWLFAMYAWSKPESFSALMDSKEKRPSTASVHDLLLNCREQTRAVCARTCLEFAPSTVGDANDWLCVATDASLSCNVTLDAITGLAPSNECLLATAATVGGPSEDYVQCWADLPEMYIMAMITMLVFAVLVQWAGMVRTVVFQDEVDKAKAKAAAAKAAPNPNKSQVESLDKEAKRLEDEMDKQGWQPLAPLMRVARVWADHYYRCADQLVGISVICSLWALTVLLNLTQTLTLTLTLTLAPALTLTLTLTRCYRSTTCSRCCSSSATSTTSSRAARARPTCSRSSSTEGERAGFGSRTRGRPARNPRSEQQ